VRGPRLSLLVGQPVNIPPGELRLTREGPGVSLPAGLPSELLVHRLEIVAAEYPLRVASASIGAARAAFFPTPGRPALMGCPALDHDSEVQTP
jgi:outer membrane protein TolC